jgi:hypothetical protein
VGHKIKRPLSLIIKLHNLINFFCRKIFFLTVISVFVLVLSQLFLLMAYLLPLKILILLSIENIPDFLSTIFYSFSREQIILILSFSVFIMYFTHLLLERIMVISVNKSLNILSVGNLSLEKDSFLKKFIETFFRLISTLLLVFLLLIVLFYIFPTVAIALLFCLLIIAIIFFSGKIEKKKITKFSQTSFFMGFMVVFIYEVIYLLYYSTEGVSIITILVSIVIVRYIFLRGVFIINKLLILYRDLNIFYKKLEDSKVN